MYIILHVKYILFLSIVMKPEYSSQTYEKYPSIKFHEYPPRESRVDSCGQMDRHDEVNNLLINFTNAPKTAGDQIISKR
jgi:hypothetical protein